MLSGDDYFKPISGDKAWGKFNDDRFIKQVIEPLKSGNKFMYSRYDWIRKTTTLEAEIVIEKGFILERCFSFSFDLTWDLKIWLETPRDTCLKRGVGREKGLPKDRVVKVWSEIWQPEEDQYIEKTNPINNAGIVLDGTKPFKEQIR